MWLSRRNKQFGLAVLTYVLVSIFLIAAVAAMVATSRWGSNTADKQWASGQDIAAQANLIRNKLLDCSAGQGSNGNASYHITFPLGTAAATSTAVTSLTCPATGQSLLSGTDGVFLPPTPTGFNAWQYTNNVACTGSPTPTTATTTPCGVYLDLTAQSSTTYNQNLTALTRAQTSLGSSVSLLTDTSYTPNYTLRVFVTY